jgi:3-oxoacyl-[acyl-carrier-protein] synthase II
VVLEPLERARARGARIWAEVVGYAATCDGTGLVVPRADGKALMSAISAALADAGIGADEVQYVNAYASATQVGDRTELRALEQVFGAGKRPLVSGLKGALGHLLAAAGAVEFVATALALDRQVVPPTVNLREPDAACHFDCVPGAARAAALRNAVTISRGIGGQNAVMVLRRAEP